MAKIKHTPDISEMIGAHSKDGIVERRKIFRDYDGKVTKVGRLEAYKPKPRNFKTSPALIRERANMSQFGAASQFARQFIDALKYKTPLPPDKQALLDNYKARFYAQLNGTPDPIAPKDKDGNYLIYARIDNFIRAVLRKERPFG